MIKKDVFGYLYKHTRLDNNEVFYIGIGTSKNYARAYNKTRRNRLWVNIANKTNYVVEIVLDNIPYSDLLEREKEFIKLYGRKNKNEGTLANLTDGGEGVLGAIKPHGGKGKSWDEICNNPEQVRINRENRSNPYNISIHSPDGNIEEIRCENVGDFNRKLKLTSKYLNILKKEKSIIIKRIRLETKHNFQTGTILSYQPIYREKQTFIYPKPKLGDRRKPFTVSIKQPDKDSVDVYCESYDDFYKKIPVASNILKSIIRNKFAIIQKIKKEARHNFSVGTTLTLI